MKGLDMYSKTQQLKSEGLNKSQVSRELQINYKTVCKYWDMTLEEYIQHQQSQCRTKKLDTYKDDILFLLYKHNDYSSAQIFDLLREKYPDDQDSIKYSTLRRYVRRLREECNIPKEQKVRQYQAVIDPPMGYQAQVDLGYDTVYDESGTPHELCAMAMVLSNSRQKYVEWFDRHPVTADFINFHERAFKYYGGMPEEIVYDQDRLLIVSENYGDIIYTYEFENYRQRMRFRTYICRSADPETKGRIESVVKYVKYNFARHRVFTNIDDFNRQTLEWLDRTGNAMIHGTTKKVPAEVFAIEKQYLRQVPDSRTTTILDASTIIPRMVRKNNTVEYESNRYSVPLGTYEPGKEVGLKVTDDQSLLQISNLETGEIIGEHSICSGKGQLVQNSNHLRDHSQKIHELYQQTYESLGSTPESKLLLDMIKSTKHRYVRDQYAVIKKSVQGLAPEMVTRAVSFVVERELWSATALASVLTNIDKLPEKQFNEAQISLSLPDKYKVVTEVRDLAEYEKLVR
jgi:transposase